MNLTFTTVNMLKAFLVLSLRGSSWSAKTKDEKCSNVTRLKKAIILQIKKFVGSYNDIRYQEKVQ